MATVVSSCGLWGPSIQCRCRSPDAELQTEQHNLSACLPLLGVEAYDPKRHDQVIVWVVRVHLHLQRLKRQQCSAQDQ